MASGFRNSAGVDFDDLFEPERDGNGHTVSWFNNARYAQAVHGDRLPSPLGFRDELGRDVQALWARKGSVVYIRDPWNLDFEDGPITGAEQAWILTGNMNINTTARETGTYGASSVYTTNTLPGGGTGAMVNKGRKPVSPNQFISVGCRVRATGASDQVGGALRVVYFNSSLQQIGSRQGNIVEIHQGQDWRWSFVRTNVPTGVAYYTVQGECYSLRSGSRVSFDNFTLNYTPPTAPPPGGGGGGGGGGWDPNPPGETEIQ